MTNKSSRLTALLLSVSETDISPSLPDISRYFEVVSRLQTARDAFDYLSGAGEFADRVNHPFPDVIVMLWRTDPSILSFNVEKLSLERFPSLTLIVLPVPS